jgi:hypothetical protein
MLQKRASGSGSFMNVSGEIECRDPAFRTWAAPFDLGLHDDLGLAHQDLQMLDLTARTESVLKFSGPLNSNQGCQIFLLQHTKTGKIYTALPFTIPNGHNIYQMTIK